MFQGDATIILQSSMEFHEVYTSPENIKPHMYTVENGRNWKADGVSAYDGVHRPHAGYTAQLNPTPSKTPNVTATSAPTASAIMATLA